MADFGHLASIAANQRTGGGGGDDTGDCEGFGSADDADDHERTVAGLVRDLAEKDRALAEKDRALAEKDQTIVELKRAADDHECVRHLAVNRPHEQRRDDLTERDSNGRVVVCRSR